MGHPRGPITLSVDLLPALLVVWDQSAQVTAKEVWGRSRVTQQPVCRG